MQKVPTFGLRKNSTTSSIVVCAATTERLYDITCRARTNGATTPLLYYYRRITNHELHVLMYVRVKMTCPSANWFVGTYLPRDVYLANATNLVPEIKNNREVEHFRSDYDIQFGPQNTPGTRPWVTGDRLARILFQQVVSNLWLPPIGIDRDTVKLLLPEVGFDRPLVNII